MREMETYRAADIVAAVAVVTGVQPHQLAAHRRNRSWSRARQLCWLVIYDHGLLSLPEIGRQFDRDHTTILHGVTVARRRVAEDSGEYDRIMRHLERPERAEQLAAAEDRVLLRRKIAATLEERVARRSRAAELAEEPLIDRQWWAENDRRFRDALLAAGVVSAFRDYEAAA